MINYRNIQEIAAAIQPLLEKSADMRILQEVSDDPNLEGREFILLEEVQEYIGEIEEEMPWYGRITPEREAFQARIRKRYAKDDIDANKLWEPDWLMIRIMGKGPGMLPVYPKYINKFWEVIKGGADALMQGTWIPEIRFRKILISADNPCWVEVIFKVSYSS